MANILRALIKTDILVDFCPGGSFAVPRGDETVAVANRLNKNGDYALEVLLQDWHPENHIAFYDLYPGRKPFEFIEIDRGPLKGWKQQLWPRHCVRNTPGAWFHPNLDITGNLLIHKGTNPDIDSLSGFYDDRHIQNTGLTKILRRLGITHVDVIGLATEFCVGLTALDAISDGFKTRLLTEGSRGLDEKAIQAMYERIIAAGGEVV